MDGGVTREMEERRSENKGDLMICKEPADLQKVWHEFVGKLFVNKTILDVGAGSGKSKKRLSCYNNIVTTSDINRALMNKADIIEYPERIPSMPWNVVTAFDVIEHVVNARFFLQTLKNLSNEFVFVTTPNWYAHPRDWHFKEDEFGEMMGKFFFKLKYFVRRKGSNYNNVRQVIIKEFFKRNQNNYAFGILGCVNETVEDSDIRRLE